MTMKRLLALSVLMVLAACSSEPPIKGQKVGKPYMIGAKMYFPEVDTDYDETGIASWYGPGFHGKYTANGEVFNQNALTAAHPTLPMPSIVRVTNTDNGKTLLVRINDRGPFAGGRIIDLSKASAEKLGVRGKGVAHVRVKYLHEETIAYLNNKGIKPAPELRASQTEYATKAGTPYDMRPPGETLTIAENQTGEAPIQSVQAIDLDEATPTPPPPVRQKPSSFGIVRSAQAAEVQPHPVAGAASDSGVAHKEIDTSSESYVASAGEDGQNNRMIDAGGSVMIQAGAFASEKNANALARKLEKLGDVEVAPLESGGKTLYRVRVLAEAENSAQALQRARAAGALDAKIIRN